MTQCRFHADRDAEYECTSCGIALCPVCMVMVSRKHYCVTCARKKRAASAMPATAARPAGPRPAKPAGEAASGSNFVVKVVVLQLGALLLLGGGFYYAYRLMTAANQPPPAIEYWIVRDGATYGPYPEARMREMRRIGTIDDQTRIKVGGGAPQPYKSVFPPPQSAVPRSAGDEAPSEEAG